MRTDEIIIMVFSILGMGFTYWYFLGKKEGKIVEAVDSIDITVDGGYNPDAILLKKGKPTKLNFFRKDPSSCLEEVVLSDFRIRKFLPLNEKTTIEITPQKTGEFKFSCGMNMFHGKLVVSE